MAEDRETEREDGQKRPSRPVTAAARRERRAARAEAAAKAPDAKGRPTRARDDSRAPRVGLFSRMFRFLREVVAELRKVIWPTRKQMITYTSVVLVFLAVMVALIAGLDVALARGVLWLFG